MNFREAEYQSIADIGLLGRGKSRHRPRNDPDLYGGSYPFVQTGDVKNAPFFELLETMAEEIYGEWFVRMRFPGRAPARMRHGVPLAWSPSTLGGILELRYGKALPDAKRMPGEHLVYGSGGVVGTHSQALVSSPGLIVGRRGNVGSVYYSDRSFFPIDTVYYVVSRLPNSFLFYLLRAMNFINNDAAVPGLNRAQAYANEFFLPTDDLIHTYADMADPLLRQTRLLRSQNKQLARTRDALLPRLISGKLKVDHLDIRLPPSMQAEAAA